MYFDPRKFPAYFRSVLKRIKLAYHELLETLKNQIFVFFKVKFRIDALEQECRFWQQQHESVLVELEEVNEKIHQYWQMQQTADNLINDLNQKLKEAEQKQNSAEFNLAKVQREADLQKQADDKLISTLKQEMQNQKTLAALDSETIAFLAQAQTDLFFQGNLQPLQGWPLISIIMPVWNQGNIVVETIKSVVEQIYPYWELLIIDDGSTDNTKQKINYLLSDKRIHYYLKEHGSLHEARNIGLAKCQGQLIAYLDADKLWAKHVLSVVANAFLCDPKCQAVYFAAVKQNFADNKKWVYFPERLLQESGEHSLDINCFVHHRSLYDQLGKYSPDLRNLTDRDLASLYQKQTKIKRLSLLGTHYRAQPTLHA